MKRKILFLSAAALLLSAAACKSNKNDSKEVANTTKDSVAIQTAEVPFVVAKQYFVKNNVENKAMNLKITEQSEFDKYFGMGTVMPHNGADGKPTSIDFTKQYVIAVVEPSSSTETQIEAKKLAKTGNTLTLTYGVTLGAKQSSESRVCMLLIVDKANDAENINFDKQ